MSKGYQSFNNSRNNVQNPEEGRAFPKAQTQALSAHLAAKLNPQAEPNTSVAFENVEALPRAQVAAMDRALGDVKATKTKPPQRNVGKNSALPPQPQGQPQMTAYPKEESSKLIQGVTSPQAGRQEGQVHGEPIEQVKALGKAFATTTTSDSPNRTNQVAVAPKPAPMDDGDGMPVPNKPNPPKVVKDDVLLADIEPKKEFSPMPRPAKMPAAAPPPIGKPLRPQANVQPKPAVAAAPAVAPTKPSQPFTNPFKLPKLPKLPKLFGKKPDAPSSSAPGNQPAEPDKPDKPSLFSRLFGKKQQKDDETGLVPAGRPTAAQQQQQQQQRPTRTDQQKPVGRPAPSSSSSSSTTTPPTKPPALPSPPRVLPASWPPRARGDASGDSSPDRQRGFPRIPAVGENMSPKFLKSGNEFGLNEPSSSARFFDKTKSALFADPLDPKRLEQIFKEFQRFAANLASVSTSMINNLNTQTNNFRSLVAKTDERRRNDLYTNFLSTLEKILDRYMQLHKVFLIDNNFSKNLQYAWQYAPDVAQGQVDAFMKNVVDPYFENIAKLTANAMPKYMVGGASSTNTDNETASPGVYYAYEKYMERLEKEREKLYDFYYNKASNGMLQWTSTHTLIYSMKFLRVLFLWMALYLTSKTFQARYVQKVFADNEDPPRLETFVLMFWALEAVLMTFVFIILYLIKYLLNSDSNFILNDGVIGKFVGDYIASTVLIVLAGLVIGRIMMKKKYFRYKSDGLRAIRSFEEVMWYISIFILAFPFFVIF